jgi:hypothetical protein
VFITSSKYGIGDDDAAVPAGAFNLQIPCPFHGRALGELENGVEAHDDVDTDDAKPEGPDMPALDHQGQQSHGKGGLADRDGPDDKPVADVEELQGDDEIMVGYRLDMASKTKPGSGDDNSTVGGMEQLMVESVSNRDSRGSKASTCISRTYFTYPRQEQNCIVPAKHPTGSQLAVEAEGHEDKRHDDHGGHDPLDLQGFGVPRISNGGVLHINGVGVQLWRMEDVKGVA